MTPQEQQLLEDFLNRLNQAQDMAKDPQADMLIRERLSGHPDALYLLVQRAILLERGLAVAKQQIAQLQQQSAQTAGTSFLGDGAAAAFPNQPPPPRSSCRERFFGSPAPAPVPAQPSFLASAATTAAGVAGGMFLAQGLENLFDGHHGAGFGGNDSNIVENVTTNNVIYDNDPDGGFSDSGLMADNNGGSLDFDDDSWS